MKINAYCTSGGSPGLDERGSSTDLVSPTSDNKPTSEGSQSQSLSELLRQKARKLSYLGLHPESIRREIELESFLYTQELRANQIDSRQSEVSRDTFSQDPTTLDLKSCKIEDDRLYSLDQIERSFKGIVNLESLRKHGMATRGGWTLGSSLKKGLDGFFSKTEVLEPIVMGGKNGKKDKNPRLRPNGGPKRMARDIRGANKSGRKIQSPGSSAGDMEDELANFKRLRAGKGAIPAKNS